MLNRTYLLNTLNLDECIGPNAPPASTEKQKQSGVVALAILQLEEYSTSRLQVCNQSSRIAAKWQYEILTCEGVVPTCRSSVYKQRSLKLTGREKRREDAEAWLAGSMDNGWCANRYISRPVARRQSDNTEVDDKCASEHSQSDMCFFLINNIVLRFVLSEQHYNPWRIQP